ncbi:MAG: M48 family metallopeptidase [Planctomycetes bacterium]|nr:M48 family metallopeptidase [Planctomycetota bacterium]
MLESFLSSSRALATRLVGALRRGVYRSTPRRGAALPALLLLAAGSSSCAGLNAYSLQDDVALGAQAFQEVTSSEKILTSGPQVEQVERVTARLVDAVTELQPDIASQFQWEVVVIDDPQTVNAFCLPGGKMAVYTGILPVTQNDAGLAVVMGHEISHATKRHGTQRLTRNGLTTGLIQAVFEDEDYEAMAMVVANFGVGLPWGRSDELEADREGLFVMAAAGYDPREAPVFWQRMAQLTGGGGGGLEEFLSTHPSNERRIEQLQSLVPEALPLYEAAKGKK